MSVERAIASAKKRLANGAPLLLLLDLDGTIADFKIDPAKVVLYPGIRPLLTKILARPLSSIVIVTGRRAKQAWDLIGLAAIDVVGMHGREWLHEGKSRLVPVKGRSKRALDRLLAIARRLARDTAGARHEDKRPGGVVLHTRGASPSKAERAEAEFAAAIREAEKHGIVRQTGKRMTEARVAGATKGTAAEKLAKAALRDAKRKRLPEPVIFFAGDDVTDEDAHIALAPFRAITVLVSKRPRPTAARFRVPSIAALRAVLALLA